jgi:hypothetical protein
VIFPPNAMAAKAIPANDILKRIGDDESCSTLVNAEGK